MKTSKIRIQSGSELSCLKIDYILKSKSKDRNPVESIIEFTFLKYWKNVIYYCIMYISVGL